MGPKSQSAEVEEVCPRACPCHFSSRNSISPHGHSRSIASFAAAKDEPEIDPRQPNNLDETH